MTTDRRALRDVVDSPGFRGLMAVRLSGQFADGLFQAALFSAVFFNPERATSAGQAAAAFATLLLPYSVVGPFAGVFLDRWRRQRVLVNANLGRSAVIGVFALLLTLQGPTAPAVVALALVVVSANRFVLSGLSAALPHVVEAKRLVTANSVSSTLGAGAAAAGGAAALGLRAVFGDDDSGAGRTSLVAAALYVGSALLARRLGRDQLGPEQVPRGSLRDALGGVVRGVLEGAAHVREHGQAGRALGAIAAHRFFYGLSFVATLLLYTEQGALHRGFSGLGQVIVVSVLGGLLAALVTPRVTRRLGTQRWITAVFAVAAVVEVAFGAPYTHAFFLVAAFFLGFAAQASKICVDTLVQEATEDAFRGRVFSFYDTLFNLSFVSAALASAFLLPPNGKSYLVIAIVAIGYAVTAATYGIASARKAAVEPPEPVVV
ncbi:MAG: MFS transporter [Actinobacteria bacterium]|nr:MFS transporter [Actinomycetota bacterium]